MDTNVSSSNCSRTTNSYLIDIFGSIGAVSVVTCLVSLCLLFFLKLHRQFLYRLAAYQVGASMLHALSAVCQFAFLEYDFSKHIPCIVVAYVFQATAWVKVCFCCWVTFHLFCFAVLLKNMKKLEPLYVISSVLFSIVISSIPLIRNSYGPTGEWCWIQKFTCEDSNVSNSNVAEQIGVWYGPAFVTLVLQSIVILWMMSTVYCRAYRTSNRSGFGREQNKKAFKQLLPLVSFPLLFMVFFIPPFVSRTYGFFGTVPSVLGVLTAVCISLWSFFAGVALIVHIGVVRCADVKMTFMVCFVKCTRRYTVIEDVMPMTK